MRREAMQRGAAPWRPVAGSRLAARIGWMSREDETHHAERMGGPLMSAETCRWTCPECRSTYAIPGSDPKTARCPKCRDVLSRVRRQPVPIATPPLARTSEPPAGGAPPQKDSWIAQVAYGLFHLVSGLCLVAGLLIVASLCFHVGQQAGAASGFILFATLFVGFPLLWIANEIRRSLQRRDPRDR